MGAVASPAVGPGWSSPFIILHWLLGYVTLLDWTVASSQRSYAVELYLLSDTPPSMNTNYCQISIIVKLREREGQRVDPGRSLKGHLWMVDGGWWISFP